MSAGRRNRHGTGTEIGQRRFPERHGIRFREPNMAHSTKYEAKHIIVAIPVHNEADYIEDCLTALARQDHLDPFEVVALLNNCSDDTARIAHGLAARLPYELHVR